MNTRSKSEERARALELLEHLDPRALDYEGWLKTGMALHYAGCSVADWEAWSLRDPERYHKGECAAKWHGFGGGGGKPVTLGTLSQMAGNPASSRPQQGYDWSDAIEIRGQDRRSAPATVHEEPIIDPRWIEAADVPDPALDWYEMDMIRYLETMFLPEEKVGIVVDCWQKTDAEGRVRWLPKQGTWDRTSQQLIEELRKAGEDSGQVIGDTTPECGAWVRINPLDGDGCKDANVTTYRHALIEADEDDLGKQLAILRELQMPCTCIVHSGKKSLHALVRVDASSMEEYRARVDRLYEVASRAGLKVDRQNRNPSRLSRLPGVWRGDRPQYLVSGRCGQADWQTWESYIADLRDDLPDPEPLSEVFANPPPLAPELIPGLLRSGHKARLVGPSKAGKSFALIQLAVAIAEGREWLGRRCRQGAVLYVNLELDRPSCINRFRDVYAALGWLPETISAIDIWNLRGHAVPMDRLTPKLIRRAHGRGYAAVIIDPIYKVLTGDENSAEQMAAFCNQFDKIATSLGCAVIDAHHHSKGSQGQKKSIDRASGSGVFGRDPDCILDFVGLAVDGERRKQVEDVACIEALEAFATTNGLDWDHIPIDERGPSAKALAAGQRTWPKHAVGMASAVAVARQRAGYMSGWRVEATLREFAPPPPHVTWFDHPVHKPDIWGLLEDAKADGEEAPWVAQQRVKDGARKEKAQAQREELEEAVRACGGAGKAKVEAVAEAVGISDRALRKRLQKSKDLECREGVIHARNR